MHSDLPSVVALWFPLAAAVTYFRRHRSFCPNTRGQTDPRRLRKGSEPAAMGPVSVGVSADKFKLLLRNFYRLTNR